MALKASVHIETAFQNNKTVLKKSFCGSPFKIADVTEDRQQKSLKLMLMSSSPGVLDGDEYAFEINVAKNCSVYVETQSYQRIFEMKTGAKQQMVVNVDANASFIYLPHPTVPHKASKISLKNKIYLHKSSTLVWSEILSCGRKLNDEVFCFSSYHSLTEIFIDDKLVVKENLLLRPMEVNVKGIGQLEGFTHQAAFIYVNQAINLPAISQSFTLKLKQHHDIEFGITELPVNGLLIRLLGCKAEQLFGLIKELSVCVQSFQNKSVANIYV